MKCLICKHGETKEGVSTVTLERGQATIVFKNVPAQICQNCGESYTDAQITKQILTEAELAAKNGVQVDVRSYLAA